MARAADSSYDLATILIAIGHLGGDTRPWLTDPHAGVRSCAALAPDLADDATASQVLWDFPLNKALHKALDLYMSRRRACGLPMLIVDTDPVSVERQLQTGRLTCPACSAVLTPWGHGRPWEVRGDLGARLFVRPRRSRCSGSVSHRCCFRTRSGRVGRMRPR